MEIERIRKKAVHMPWNVVKVISATMAPFLRFLALSIQVNTSNSLYLVIKMVNNLVFTCN